MKHYINKSDQMRRVVTKTKTYFLKQGQVVETNEEVIHFEKGVQEKDMSKTKKKSSVTKTNSVEDQENKKEDEREPDIGQDA